MDKLLSEASRSAPVVAQSFIRTVNCATTAITINFIDCLREGWAIWSNWLIVLDAEPCVDELPNPTSFAAARQRVERRRIFNYGQ